jgi:hypothetical protein
LKSFFNHPLLKLKILSLILVLTWFPASVGQCDLLFVSSSRWFETSHDLTQPSASPANLGPAVQYYSQGMELYFSSPNDASWAEVVLPDGSSYPLNRYLKNQNQLMFQNLTNALIISNATLIFSEGASFQTREEMNQYLPAGQYLSVRFGGGDLGSCQDQLLIVDDSQFFNNPPQITASESTLKQLIGFDTKNELSCSVVSTAPWQMVVQDSVYKSIFSTGPLPVNTNAVMAPNLLQPGLVYSVSFYTGTGDIVSSNSFAGFTRASTDPQIPMASGGIGISKNYYIRTRSPLLRLKQRSMINFSNQTSRMNVEFESNPGYTGLLEFTESLSGAPVWTGVTNAVSFGTNGTGSLTLEKPGDFRGQWDQRLFFRVRNQRPPLETTNFIPTP